jgi:transposase
MGQSVLLPRRWAIERCFGRVSRFRRLAHDYERSPETLAGLHFLAFVILMLKNVAEVLAYSIFDLDVQESPA